LAIKGQGLCDSDLSKLDIKREEGTRRTEGNEIQYSLVFHMIIFVQLPDLCTWFPLWW